MSQVFRSPGKPAFIFALAALCSVSSTSAWVTEGHRELAEAAVEVLPESVPAFFRQGVATIGHCAVDPDVMKDRSTPQLRNQESPEHYLDREYFESDTFPETRYRFMEELAKAGQKPYNVGLLPYSITEGTQRLALSFAEHRRWPDDPSIHMKSLVYAGILAHYAGDLMQPLHTTKHYDGRVVEEGESPRTGIHFNMDGAVRRVPWRSKRRLRRMKPVAYTELFPTVLEKFHDSHLFVDRVYELEGDLAQLADGSEPSAQLRRFIEDRAGSSVQWIADLFYTAWVQSATIQLPQWHNRKVPSTSAKKDRKKNF